MNAYRNYEILVAPARAYASLWRLFGGCCLIVVGTLALEVLLHGTLGAQGQDQLIEERAFGTSARGALLALYAFALPAMVLWIVLRLLHDRSLRAVAGTPTALVRDFFRAMIAGMLVVALVLILPKPSDAQPVANLGFALWLRLLPFSLFAVFIQVSCEELIFRGYLQSQLAARFKNPAIWLLLPSMLFGALHYAPGVFGENAWLVALWATLFGLVAADLTARTGTLGAAIALHFVNNVVGILIVAMSGHLDGLALQVTPFGPEDTALMRILLLVELPALFCLWLAVRLALRR